MKKSRFTEQQIIGILKQPTPALKCRTSAASTASAPPPMTSGSPSTAAWKLLTLSGCARYQPHHLVSRGKSP